MAIELKERRGVAVLKISDSLSSSQAVDLKCKLEELLVGGQSRVVLNMRRVRKVNRAGISVMIERLTEFRHKDGDLKLAGVHPMLLRYFTLLGVGSIFEIFTDENSAIHSFQRILSRA